MVMCDVCDKWHHYKCVGANSQIADIPWSCNKECKIRQSEKCSTTSLRSSTSSARRRQLEMQQLEEEKKLAEKMLEAKAALEVEYIRKKFQLMQDAELNEKCSQLSQHERVSEWIEENRNVKISCSIAKANTTDQHLKSAASQQ